MTRPDDVVRHFNDRFTCSAAVFSAFAPDLGLDEVTARKIACGFGAGISKTGNICGAVSGAIMVIGLKYGKSTSDDEAATERTRELTRRFMDEFTRRNGSVSCTELLGYNLNDPDDYEAAHEANLFRTKCPEYVRHAAEILERIL